MQLLGSKISLISKSEIRYEGILFTLNPNESTLALAKGKHFSFCLCFYVSLCRFKRIGVGLNVCHADTCLKMPTKPTVNNYFVNLESSFCQVLVVWHSFCFILFM